MKQFNKKISIVYFTYKRAILLDASIQSLEKNFKQCIHYPINIIYNYDKDHDLSYKKLKKKYGDKIFFYKRKKLSFFHIAKYFFRPLNFLWFLRYPKMLVNLTNFKQILEKILKENNTDFIMMNTDDTIFYKKFNLPKEILLKIKPKTFFFRGNFGLELLGDYKAKKNSFNFFYVKNKKFITWNSKNKKINYHMRYHFQVEGAIFFKKNLLNLLNPIIYHNPITLESIGYRESKLRNFFTNTITFGERVCASYEINSVQSDNNLRFNERIQVNPDLLKNLYIKNYILVNMINKKNEKFARIVPKKIFLKKIGSKKKLVLTNSSLT